MADLPPELAEKVLDAERRNLVKNVGEGGTLSGPARQIFLDIAHEGATADDLREMRVNALLRKWLDGGRLSREERDEISHLIPDATAITIEAVPLPQKQGALTEDEIIKLYEISRAKYFRWKQEGAAVPGKPDPPPFDSPAEMVSWYERMKARGIFKKRCPPKLHALARGDNPPPKSRIPAAAALASQIAPSRTGFLVEFEEAEKHCAKMREDYTIAYERGETARADTLRAQYQEMFAELRKSSATREAIKIAEDRVRRDLEAEMVLIIPSVVANLLMLAPVLHREGQCTIPLSDFEKLCDTRIRAALSALLNSKFAQPLMLQSA